MRAPSRDEEAAQILDVRLAGGVHDRRLAGGERSGHDGVLRPGHRRLVEEDLRPDEAVRLHVEAPVGRDLRPEARQRVDVRVEAPPADDVSAGRRHDCLAQRATSGPARRMEARMRVQSSASSSVFFVLGDDPHDAVAEALDLDPEVGHELEHRLDVRIAGTL